jgi:predicted membrane protein
MVLHVYKTKWKQYFVCQIMRYLVWDILVINTWVRHISLAVGILQGGKEISTVSSALFKKIRCHLFDHVRMFINLHNDEWLLLHSWRTLDWGRILHMTYVTVIVNIVDWIVEIRKCFFTIMISPWRFSFLLLISSTIFDFNLLKHIYFYMQVEISVLFNFLTIEKMFYKKDTDEKT